MNEDFRKFLLERSIGVEEYNAGTLGEKAKLVEAFAKESMLHFCLSQVICAI